MTVNVWMSCAKYVHLYVYALVSVRKYLFGINCERKPEVIIRGVLSNL